MEKFTSQRQLAEMRKMSGGNQRKIAKYALAKREREDLIKKYFKDEGLPFPVSPSPQYVQQLEKEAKSGDEAAQMRHAMIADVIESQDYANNGAHRDANSTLSDMRQKLNNGESITQADLKATESAVRHFSSTQNLALYTLVKRAAEAAAEEPAPQPEKETPAEKSEPESDRYAELTAQIAELQKKINE
ncbi:hypothetical protein [Indiicoccus explosivorum]|uniref:hypothetical protein n=1 Tax=Indiicoccus explosivorum TaxID=1917864 RepID=UPI000B442903|nr:hypothetical protein [Indiicoccus explosivorum]